MTLPLNSTIFLFYYAFAIFSAKTQQCGLRIYLTVWISVWLNTIIRALKSQNRNESDRNKYIKHEKTNQINMECQLLRYLPDSNCIVIGQRWHNLYLAKYINSKLPKSRHPRDHYFQNNIYRGYSFHKIPLIL